MSSREDWERRKQEISEAMMPFVREGQPHFVMKNQYEQIGAIVDGCWRLDREGDVWLPEFTPGTDVRDACHVAWTIHCHTRMPVRFKFNGVEIRLRDIETKGRA